MSDDASQPERASHAAVDSEHPWLGLAAFTEETRDYFFGRENEIAELARRVRRKLLTILFGQSGLGKTSILRAGLVPRLRPEGYCPVYVRIDYSPDSPPPAEQIKEAIFRATRESGEWTQVGVAASNESLWEFLHHRDDVLRDATGRTLTPLLIFDQFEEIFTIAQSDTAGRERAAQFLEDLGDLVENRAPEALEMRMERDDSAAERFDFTRADYRILISLREDYLASLEGLKGRMPSITQNRMRLAPMTGAQALAAVQKPGGRLVARDVAEAIVRFAAGTTELSHAEVEPSLLSLICSELNNARIAQGREEISADLLAGSRDTILAEFYERALADQVPGVRRAIEDLLLTESGHRESLAEERLIKAFAAAGAAPDTLATLVDRRLLRVEERLDVRRVELTHDVLCGVVRASRDLRLEREARDDAERKLAWQRERERETRNALARTRKVAVVCAVLALGAVAGAIFGFVSMQRARDAEARADETRLMAETARSEAEKLIVYLLDDFYLELAPVGRLEVVAALAKRALDYYDALPEALRTTQTQRNRGLALVRYGATLSGHVGKRDEGTKAINDGVEILSRVREQGDESEATAIGLALGYYSQAQLAAGADRAGEALAPSARAVEFLKPLATRPNASIAARRAYGELLRFHGRLETINRQFDAAIASLEAARAAYRSIDELRDMAAASGYAEATAWLVDTLTRVDRGDDAMRSWQEVSDITKRVLDERPGNMQALRAQALATSPLVTHLRQQMRLTDALTMADNTLQAWREFVRLDPANAAAWNNLSVAMLEKTDVLYAMGRLGDAAATAQSALSLEAQSPTGSLHHPLSTHAGQVAYFESLRGNARKAEEALAVQKRLLVTAVESLPPDGYLRATIPLSAHMWRAFSAYASGDHEQAFEHSGAFITKMEAIHPSTVPDRDDQLTQLINTYRLSAVSAYALRDYGAMARLTSRLLELRAQYVETTLQDQRAASVDRSLSALALARLDRKREAIAHVEPALKLQRDLAALGRDDPSQRLEFAIALYAAAVAGAGDSKALLAEAGAQIQRQPSEMARTKRVALWRDRINEERAARR